MDSLLSWSLQLHRRMTSVQREIVNHNGMHHQLYIRITTWRSVRSGETAPTSTRRPGLASRPASPRTVPQWCWGTPFLLAVSLQSSCSPANCSDKIIIFEKFKHMEKTLAFLLGVFPVSFLWNPDMTSQIEAWKTPSYCAELISWSLAGTH